MGGQGQTKKTCVEEELARGSVLPKGEARMDVFARCLERMTAQVCTNIYNIVICVKKEGNWDVVSCLQISVRA